MKAAPASLSPPGWGCHRRLLPSRQHSSAQPLSCLCSALALPHPPAPGSLRRREGCCQVNPLRKSSNIRSPCGEVQRVPLGWQHPSAGAHSAFDSSLPSVPARQFRSSSKRFPTAPRLSISPASKTAGLDRNNTQIMRLSLISWGIDTAKRRTFGMGQREKKPWSDPFGKETPHRGWV